MRKTIVINRVPEPVPPVALIEGDVGPTAPGILLFQPSRLQNELGNQGRESLIGRIQDALESAFKNRFSAHAAAGFEVFEDKILADPTADPDEPDQEWQDNPFFLNPNAGDDHDEDDVSAALELYEEAERWVPWHERVVCEPFSMKADGETISGIAFLTHAEMAKLLDVPADEIWRLTPEDVEQYSKALQAEMRELSHRILGNVYEFSIYEHEDDEAPEDGEQIDGCSGFVSPDDGEDYRLNGMADCWPSEWESTYRIVSETSGEIFAPPTPSTDKALFDGNATDERRESFSP